MMVDICCPTCHLTKTMPQPSGGAWFECPDCGTAIHFSRPPAPIADDYAETPLMPSPLEGRPSGRDMTALLRSPLYSLMPVAIDDEEEPTRQLPPDLATARSVRPARRSRVLPLAIAALLGATTVLVAARVPRVSNVFRLPAGMSLTALTRLSGIEQPKPAHFSLVPADETPPEVTTEPAPAAPEAPSTSAAAEVVKSPFAMAPAPAPNAPYAAPRAQKPKPEVTEIPEAPSTSAAPEFDQAAANAALAEVTSHLSECADSAVGAITTRASVSFVSSGRATAVTVVPLAAMVGSPMVPCVVRRLRAASVPPFEGDTVTVHTTITVQ
jgi:hypothetical protein